MSATLGRVPSRSPIAEATVEGDESTSVAVLTAVAAVSNRSIDDLPPLCERIDTDALDGLFLDETMRGSVSFRYNGYIVVATADERVQVYEEEASP